MKRLLLLSFLVLCLSSLAAQENQFVFGTFEPPRDQPCLTEEQRREIQQRIAQNLANLKLSKRSPQRVLLAWPLRASVSLPDYGYHGVWNFVDHNPAFPGQLQDYDCGTRSYDQSSGYNHRGIDYFLWPFTWNKVDEQAVEIVSAAPGVIVYKQDGEFDRSCGFNNNPWNAVYVQHDDGTVAWYGHMKANSVTPKGEGANVEVGEYLGVVGSSGNSTGPHLHFELYDANGNLVDPYQGPCNPTTTDSWWIEQPPYYDSAINALMTHTSLPEFQGCPMPEVSNASNSFLPGQTVYFAAYYRDQLNTQTSHFTIFRPDNSVFHQWSNISDAVHYAASYWIWWLPLPVDAPEGVWKFAAEYEGASYVHDFTVGTVAPKLRAVPDHSVFEGQNYHLTLHALGNPAPEFALAAAPPGMTVAAENGVLTWAPDDEHAGTHLVSVRATNALGSDSLAFLVSVTAVNDAPTPVNLLTPADNDTLSSMSEPVRFSWEASIDADDDTLTYTLLLYGGNRIDTTLTVINTTTLDFDGSGFFKPGQSYAWQVAVSDGDHIIRTARPFQFHVSPTVRVNERQSELPHAYRLYQNYPNPFNPETTITYDLPVHTTVSLMIYDVLGRPVKELAKGVQQAGHHMVRWDGKDAHARPAPSGVYVYRLRVAEQTLVGRLLLLQ